MYIEMPADVAGVPVAWRGGSAVSAPVQQIGVFVVGLLVVNLAFVARVSFGANYRR